MRPSTVAKTNLTTRLPVSVKERLIEIAEALQLPINETIAWLIQYHDDSKEVDQRQN